MEPLDLHTLEAGTLDAQTLISELFGRPMYEAPEAKLVLFRHLFEIKGLREMPSQKVAARLVERHHHIMKITAEHDLPIRFIGFGRIPRSFQVFAGPDCDWVVQSVPNDPLYKHRDNRLPVPEPVRTEVEHMIGAGTDFTATVSAHAVQSGLMNNQTEVALRHIAPRPDWRVAARLSALEKGVTLLRRGTEAIIKATAVAGAALSAGAIAAPAALAAALPLAAATPLIILDPILFGVEIVDGWQAEDGQPIGSWYYLTHWYWPVLEEGE